MLHMAYLNLEKGSSPINNEIAKLDINACNVQNNSQYLKYFTSIFCSIIKLFL